MNTNTKKKAVVTAKVKNVKNVKASPAALRNAAKKVGTALSAVDKAQVKVGDMLTEYVKTAFALESSANVMAATLKDALANAGHVSGTARSYPSQCKGVILAMYRHAKNGAAFSSDDPDALTVEQASDPEFMAGYWLQQVADEVSASKASVPTLYKAGIKADGTVKDASTKQKGSQAGNAGKKKTVLDSSESPPMTDDNRAVYDAMVNGQPLAVVYNAVRAALRSGLSAEKIAREMQRAIDNNA